MSRPMRILHIIASLAPRLGGPSAAAPAMASALAERGHDVHIVTSNFGGAPAECGPLGVPVPTEGYTTWTFEARAIGPYAFSLPMARALRRQVPAADVVHLHSLYLLHSAVGGAYARRFGVPYIVRPHGTLDAYIRRRHRARKAVYEWLIERRNLAGADAIHYTSESEEAQAREAGVLTRGYVIPLGVSLPPSLPEIERDSDLVLFLGRLSEKKGLLLLADAFVRLQTLRPASKLVVAGPDDGMAEPLRRRLRELGLESGVQLRGEVAGLEKWSLLASASVFVLPSSAENFGIAAVEAMATGTPVVVSREVAVSEHVSRSRAGLVVPREPDALADALRSILDDPVNARSFGASGRGLVNSAYSWNAIGALLEEMYREVAARGDGRRERRSARRDWAWTS